MTIAEAFALVKDGKVEATNCGLATHFACWFIHGGAKYMLSEIKGHTIALWDVTTAPNKVIDEILLKGE